MKKKFLSLLLVLCFVMAFGSITALAAEGQTTDIWDGTADTSWYTGHETESEYHITTAEQLAGLAQLINTGTITFEGKTVYLDNDLDLDKREWIYPLAKVKVEIRQHIVFVVYLTDRDM